ncbi:MAG: trigger factor [Dehalococcoidia bacterium]|nr:trigger factor [Dehalococcoidia bacterium]|tara:strand:+ start:11230 stop:12519 length:1290 start_codon:yes stop_codon:yes gene_type:complete
MNIDIKEEKNKQVDIEILVDDFLVTKHLKSSAQKISKSTSIKGFRKGKVPYNIIESQYGRDYILENSLDAIIQEVAQDVLQKNKFEYPCAPKVDILEREPKLKINLMVPMMPEVTVGIYKNITTTTKKEKVSKSRLDEAKNRILESRATWEPSDLKLDFPGFAKINLTAICEEKVIIEENEFDFYAVENSNLIAPGVSENLKGIKKGDKKTFTLTLPLDWKEEEYQGKNAKFDVECISVQKKVLPKLDKKFLKELNPEIKDVKDFESQLKEEITAENEYKYNIELETEILEKLLKKSKFNIAEIQIQRSADQIIEERVRSVSQYNMKFDDYLKAINKTNEEFYKETLETAEDEIKRFLIIEEIISKEKFEVSEQEIFSEVELIKQQYKDQKLADDETLKNHVKSNLQRKKCLEFLVKSSKKTTTNRKKK